MIGRLHYSITNMPNSVLNSTLAVVTSDRGCNFHIRALRHIRPCLTASSAATLVCSIVGSRIDYCNSVLHGTSGHNLDRLQRVQNSLAKIVFQKNYRSSALPLLYKLHWLPVRLRIIYKIAVTTFRAFREQTPLYLHSLIHAYVPGRALRSTDSSLLVTPPSGTVASDKSFMSTAPCIWNALPQELRDIRSLHPFKKYLKTWLFKAAFSSIA